jgi:hypothetical protein
MALLFKAALVLIVVWLVMRVVRKRNGDEAEA